MFIGIQHLNEMTLPTFLSIVFCLVGHLRESLLRVLTCLFLVGRSFTNDLYLHLLARYLSLTCILQIIYRRVFSESWVGAQQERLKSFSDPFTAKTHLIILLTTTIQVRAFDRTWVRSIM